MHNNHIAKYLGLFGLLALAPGSVGHNATYYTHYTNSAAGLNLNLNPSQAVYWSGATLAMEIRAFGYIMGRNGGWVSSVLPVDCFIDGQLVSSAYPPFSPVSSAPVSSFVPVLGLAEGAHTVRVEHTNTWEYFSETTFSSSYRHTQVFSTYYHYYYNVFHYRTVPCSASQTFTVLPSTNFHKIQLDTRTPVNVLLDESLEGAAGTAPSTANFICSGEVSLDGNGNASLQTWSWNESSLRSVASVAAAGQIRLNFRASTYAEGTTIYGDGQPRGLRAGTDPNNVIEFYSASGTSLGIRTRKNGVESSATFPFPAGVGAFNDYQVEATGTAAVFSVNGNIIGTLTSNLPTGALSFFMGTFDGYAGNVPATLDSVQLAGTDPANKVCEVSYTAIPTNTYWLYWSWDLANWNLHSSSRSSTNGTAVWHDSLAPGQKFYRILGP